MKVITILIHGLFSGPSVWDDLVNSIQKDSFLERTTSIHRFQYPTPRWTWRITQRIPDLDDLTNSFQIFYSQLIDQESGPVVVIAHSQGGIILQSFLCAMLRGGRGRDLSSIRRCILLACPTNGSEFLLSIRKGLGRLGLWHHPQESTLRPLNARLHAIQQTVIQSAVYAKWTGTNTCPIHISAYAGESDNIVTSRSAHCIFPDPGTLPGDHHSILRPIDSDPRLHRMIKAALFDARASLPSDRVALHTRHIMASEHSLLARAHELHQEEFASGAAARRHDIEYWLNHYEAEHGFPVRLLGAFHNDDLLGVCLYHISPKYNLMVIDYLVAASSPLPGFHVKILVERLRYIARLFDVSRVVFEVEAPLSDRDDRRRRSARIRLFRRFGARVIAGLAYLAPNMARLQQEAEEPYALMYATTNKPPTKLSRSEVEEILDFLYLHWYRNWFSRGPTAQEAENYLRDLRTRHHLADSHFKLQ